jgi:hypothetical protein
MRIKKVIGVGAMVGGIGIAAAACGPVNVHWETYPTGTSASLRTAEQHWWVNGGGDALLAVNRDATALYGDFTNESSETKALTDARALARDAATAARNPWPGNPSAYATMMSDYAAAAQDALANNPNALNELEAASTIQTNAGWGTDFPAVPANLTK